MQLVNDVRDVPGLSPSSIRLSQRSADAQTQTRTVENENRRMATPRYCFCTSRTTALFIILLLHFVVPLDINSIEYSSTALPNAGLPRDRSTLLCVCRLQASTMCGNAY